MALREQHRRAGDFLWAGMLGSQFTPSEIALLSDYLSAHDRDLIRSLGKKAR